MYLVFKGTVKLYAENDFPFAIFRDGSNFGEVDILCNQKRNGTAKPIGKCQLYKISRNTIESIFVDYPLTKNRLILQSIERNEELIKKRKRIFKNNYLYAIKDDLAKQAEKRIKEIQDNLKGIKTELKSVMD